MISALIVRKAIAAARKSNCQRGRVGAVLFTSKGRTITQAHNKIILGETDKRFTIHAEEALIAKIVKMKAVERLKSRNLNILVVRWKPSIANLANAKPCARCAYLLGKIGIRTFYSDANGTIQRLRWAPAV